MATLQELINSVLSDGVTAEEGQAVMNAAIASGASAEQISAMSGIPVSEINQFIALNGTQGTLPAAAPTPSNPSGAIPVSTTPTPTPPLPPQENLGNTSEGDFGSDPGARGFSDKNPAITGADNVTQTAIPELLKPFLAQSVDASQGAMTGLTRLLARDNALTSPLNDLQIQAQLQALGIASGEGGFLTQAQNVFKEIADPEDIIKVFNDGTQLMANPNGTARIEGMVDNPFYNATANNALESIASGTSGNQSAMNTLQSISNGMPANQSAINALQSTADGNFLYGGQGFNEAVQASIRQALPNIDSNFALQGGAGAVSGGLRDAAVAEVTADAFARQFSNERANQLGAANQLNNFGLNSNNQRLDAANQLNNFGLNNDSQRISAANQLNNFGLNTQQQRLGGASTLAGLQQNAGAALIDTANNDRRLQFQAAAALPQMGLLNSSIMGQIGASRQQQEERTKLGQVQAMQQLLNSSFGNINPNALFGNINSVQQNNNSVLSGLGGALAGSEIGGLFEGSLFGLGGGQLGAIAGGLLGAFGS